MNRFLEKKYLSIYFIMILLESIFYLVADFGKTLTVGYGIVSMLICILLFIAIYINSNRFVSLLIILLTILQFPPIYNWIFWSGANFVFLKASFEISIVGAIYHILILLLGIHLLIKKNKKKGL